MSQIDSLVSSFLQRGFRLTVDREKLRRTTTTITKRKKLRRMSKDLNAKNNLPDMFRVLEKDWPLSKNDRKLTMKQQDHQDA
jgi:hypothetical protein